MLILLIFTAQAWAQNNDETANAQIIHNAADPAVDEVDIWIDGATDEEPAIEGVEFRSATEFLEIPAGEIEIAIAPAGGGYDNALTFDIEPSEDGNYVLIANGVVDPNDFAANPDDIEIDLELFARDEARTEATEEDEVDFFAVHGATDAPEVGIYERGGLEIAAAASYGDLTDYLTVPADEYTIDITAPENPDDIMFEAAADFSELAGGAAAVLASGFLSPEDNQDGPEFGLLVAASDGTTLFLEMEPFVERAVSFNTQALDLTADDTEVVVEDVTSADGDYVVITIDPEDGDFEGAEIVGFTQVGELEDESVAVDVEGADPVDHVAHVVSDVSQATLDAGTVSGETLENVRATSEAAAVYAVVEFNWEDETSAGPASTVTIDAIEILYDGEIGENYISVDLHEATDGEIGAFVGISQDDLLVNERHEDVTVDVVEAVDPADEDPERVDSAIEEDGEFFAMAHLGEAGEDNDGNRIPAQSPALLTSDNTALVPMVGDFAFVTIEGQVANAQIIHNAADPAVEEVDIWLDGESDADPTLSEVAFRSATEFLEIPAGQVEVALAPTGAGYDEAVTFDLEPEVGAYYSVIASGVVDPDEFAENPDEIEIGLDLLVRDEAQLGAEDEDSFEFFVGHNVTDAPSVGLAVDGSDDFLFDISSAAYGDLTGYGSVPADNYVINLTAADDIEEVLLQFDVDVSDLGGSAAAVLASGFLDPSANQDGESFALLVALADGTTLTIDPIEEDPVANAQIIHNAADPAVEEVDIWLDGESGADPTLSEVAFRSATEFLEIPAGQVEVALAPTGAGYDEAVTFDLEPEAGAYYSVIASGVVDPGEFAENPDEIEIGLDLLARDDAQLEADDEDEFEFFVGHNVTDAPSVGLAVDGAEEFLFDISSAAYGDLTGYGSVPADDYVINLTAADDIDEVLLQFDVDVSDLGGSAAAVLASGFLDPSANQDGESFALLVTLADGTTLTIDPIEEDPVANAQIIHNAADPMVDEVDVWVNEELTLEEFGFREATPFVEIPAGEVEVAIGPAGSDLEDAFTFDLTPDAGGYYTLIANGVVDSDDFAENPDGADIDLEILARADSRTEAEDEDEIDFFVVHGVTDAPAVDVRAREADMAIVENAAYGDITDYISVEPATYRLDITLPGETEALFSFLYDFEDLAGSSAAVLASGFVDPDANQGGEAFTLIAVLADGTVVEAQDITSSEDEIASDVPQEYRLKNNYPNPFNPTTNIEYQLPEAENVRLSVYDVLGREVAVLVNEEQQAGTYTVTFDGADLSSGTYIYRITAGSFNQTGKMMLVK